MGKKKLHGFLVLHWRHIFLGVVVLASIWFLTTRWSDFSQLKGFKPSVLAPLLILHLVYLFINGLIFKVLVGSFDIKLTVIEYFGLTITTNFANYFVPARLGVATKGVYLRKKSNLPYGQFSGYFFAQTILMTIAGALWGIGGTWFGSFPESVSVQLYIFFCTVLFLAIIPTIVPPLRFSNSRFWLFSILKSFLDGWNRIRADRVVVFKVIMLNLPRFLISSLCIKFLFDAFLLSIPLSTAFVMGILLSFLNYANLTPANLGIQEAFFVFLSKLFGFGFEAGIVACGLNRVVQMVIVFSLMPLFSYLLSEPVFGKDRGKKSEAGKDE